ncbi:hypothetical protein [Senegalia massiliensis]|uniref:Uncharacterized protein n=1 Tax=Senegalia massiliensis TaxID=1720316 RepID=A0A845QX99_9CLOT|nr:hypothetical protein [Senegalia massiliensis]NBI07577.1 hypothetical protein [Senegalia massiliensis]
MNLYLTISNFSEREEKRIESIEKNFELDDYYSLYREVQISDSNIKQIIKEVYVTENLLFDRAEYISQYIENQERREIRDNFLSSKRQRFFLIPFLGKIKSEIIEPIVILTIYDVGILTLEVMIGHNEKKLTKIDDNDTHVDFYELKFYKKLSKYKLEDYFKYEILKSSKNKDLGIKEVKKYYKDLIEQVSQVKIQDEEDFTQTSNIIGILNGDTQGNGIDKFLEQNIEKVYQYLTNSDKDILDFKVKKQIKNKLFEKAAFNNKSQLFIVNNSLSVHLFNDYILHKRIIDNYKEIGKELKEIDKDEIFADKKDYIYESYHEILLFYEINLIRKFYAKKLLNDMSKMKDLSHEKLSRFMKELDFILLQFDEEILFRYDGSPKDLYTRSYSLCGAKRLVDKCKVISSNLALDMKNEEEVKERSYKNTILLFSTILSVLLSFSGIQSIVYNVLRHVTFNGKFKYFNEHPLRTTILIWLSTFLIIVIIFINQKNKQKDKKTKSNRSLYKLKGIIDKIINPRLKTFKNKIINYLK